MSGFVIVRMKRDEWLDGCVGMWLGRCVGVWLDGCVNMHVISLSR